MRSAPIFTTIACCPRHGKGLAHARRPARSLFDRRNHRRWRDTRRHSRTSQSRHAENAIRSHCDVAQSAC